MEKMTLTFDYETMFLDYIHLHDCFDQHLSYMDNEEAWLTAEALAKVCAFVDIMGEKFPIIVASVSEDMAECALEVMREWSENIEPSGGWPESLIRRLRSG